MRVLHVDGAREWRGGQNQVLLTARGMAARGHEVAVACRDAGRLESRAREEGLPVHAFRFRGDFSPLAVVPLARLVRRFRPDVVQLHDPHAVAAGVLAARLARPVRLVATRRVDFHLRRRLSRRKYLSCERLIAVSGAILRVLEEDGLPAERLRLVHEGVPDRRPGPGACEALRALGIPVGSLVIGNVAALTDHKDHATLLRAAVRVLRDRPEARFLVVGDGELRASLEETARALGLEGRCVFAGFRTDLDVLIPAFDVFCLSSKTEGLGTSLLDAMCFARPVVATGAGGIPEAVEDGVTGRLAPVGRPDALADAILELLRDPERREEMGRAGRRRFEEGFTMDHMVERTLAVYGEMGRSR